MMIFFLFTTGLALKNKINQQIKNKKNATDKVAFF